FINEAAPYMDFAHAMIRGQESGVTHIPCWLITDIRSLHRYVVGGHLPIPKVPFAPVPTGHKVPKAWLDSGIVKEANSFEQLAEGIRGAPPQPRAHARRERRPTAQTSPTRGPLQRVGAHRSRRRLQPRRFGVRQLLRRPHA